MANKGETKSMKRLNAPRTAKIKRKESKFIARTICGPHARNKSVSLLTVLNDLLNLSKTRKEAKLILNEGKLLVDGTIVKDVRRPIGFMDVISIPSIDKFYRAIYDRHGRIALHEIDRRNSGFKLSKITGKTRIKKGVTQLNMHDGKNILIEKDTYSIGDVLKISVPDNKIVDSYALKEGNIAYVTGGKHAGQTGVVKGIIEGTMMRSPLAVLQSKENEFQTRKYYVFVLGTKEPAVQLG